MQQNAKHSSHFEVLSEKIKMKFLFVSLVVLSVVKLSLQGGSYAGSGRSYNQPDHTQLITGTESQLSKNGGTNLNSGSHPGGGSNDQYNPHTSQGKEFLVRRVYELSNNYLWLQADISIIIPITTSIRTVKVPNSAVAMKGILLEVLKKNSGLEVFH